MDAEELVRAIAEDPPEEGVDDPTDWKVDHIAPALASLMAVLNALLKEGDTDERKLL